VPVASLVVAHTHNWSSLLYLTTVVNLIAVALVLLVLHPAERRYYAAEAAAALKGHPAE
jgi:hypothetical protein